MIIAMKILVTLIAVIPITVVNLVDGYTKRNMKNLQSTTFKYYGLKNTTMESEMKTIQGITKYMCLMKCRNHPLCLAFSYANNSLVCNMYEHDSESANVSLIPAAGVWLYDVHNNSHFIKGNIDYCVQGHRCLNGGSCRKNSSSSGYFCTCTDNYHGQFCQDSNGPPILKCPLNQIVTADSECMATARWQSPNVTDNSGYRSTALCDYVSGSTLSNYITIVTCNATDDFDNTGYCNFTVTIYDKTVPNVTCPSDIEVCTDLGTYSVNATWEAAVASDNCCSKVDIFTNYTSGEPLSIGVYTVGYTAEDCFENTGSCKFTVEVKDCEPPALKCPPKFLPYVNITGDEHFMATIFWTAPTVTDNTGYSLRPMCDYMNGSTFTEKNTTVTCNATDDYGNTGYCTFNIFLIDYPRDCTELLENIDVASSGDYMIHPHDQGEPFRVYCDMDTDGSGWTVFQKREDGTIDFYKNWSEYKLGFGNVNNEHWLGNEKIHRISSAGNYALRVDMSSFGGESKYARYDNFRLADEQNNYKLILGSYSGDAGDSLGGHRNSQFSTYDRDHDTSVSSSCAVNYRGAWWYSSCHSSNLNGLYLRGATDQYATGVVWNAWKGYHYSLKTTEMKIRRL